jgi:hypothetical protein
MRDRLKGKKLAYSLFASTGTPELPLEYQILKISLKDATSVFSYHICIFFSLEGDN